MNPSLGPEDSLEINPDHIGFYRVNYEDTTWDEIAGNLSSDHSVRDSMVRKYCRFVPRTAF